MAYVAARCPQCGGEIQLDNQKKSGFCMHCGSKIVVEEAIKTVRIDNTHMVSNWMKMGDSADEGGNYSEAYEYFTKVLEVEPDNWWAIFKKGKAAGWQSTLANLRISEAAICFGQAINLAPDDQKETIKLASAEEVRKLALALISLRAERYIKWPDKEEADGFLSDISNILNAVFQLNKKSGFVVTGFMEPIATQIYSSVMSAYNSKIKPEYIGDEKHAKEYEWNKYIERIGYCTLLIEKAIGLSADDDQNDIQRYEALIQLHNDAINSSSWDWDKEDYLFGKYWNKQYELAHSAKLFRRNLISEYSTKVSQIKDKVRTEEEAVRQEKDRKAKDKEDKYWASHPLEKAKKEQQDELARKEVELELAQQEKIKLEEEEIEKISKEKNQKKVKIFSSLFLLGLISVYVMVNLILPRNNIKSANEKVSQNQLKDALMIVNDVLASHPTNHAALQLKYDIAGKYNSQSQYTQASDIFSEITGFEDSELQALQSKYLYASEFLENQDYENAIEVLQTIPTLEQANSLLNEAQYQYGQQFCSTNEFEKGIFWLNNIRDYKDAEEKILNYEIASIQTANVKDIILFGIESNNDKPIRWRVLDKLGSQVLLMSESLFGELAHNEVNTSDVNWDGSAVRIWLNNDFYNTSFSENEKKKIAESNIVNNRGNNTRDKIFLLSEREVNQYLKTKSERIASDGWWLRDNGNIDHYFVAVWGAGGFNEGEINDGVISTIRVSIRPVMWVDIGDETPIPIAAPISTAAPNQAREPFEYVVKQYDTCSEIALTFGIDIQELLVINNFPDSFCSSIYTGQIILVPATN